MLVGVESQQMRMLGRSSRASLGTTKVRGIMHQLAERGLARLLCTDDFSSFQGVLLNESEDTFSVFGQAEPEPSSGSDLLEESESEQASSSDTPPPTRHMHVTIVDGETGARYVLDKVPAHFDRFEHPLTHAQHLVLRLDHPAIKFETHEVLIGNKADVAIHRYIDPNLSGDQDKKVLVGRMSLKVVAQERTAPTQRRLSECLSPSCTAQFIEQSNDFLA